MQEDLKSTLLERYNRLPRKDRASRLADAAGLSGKAVSAAFKSGKAAKEVQSALERGIYQLEMEELDAAPEPASATEKAAAPPSPDPWAVGREVDELLGRMLSVLAQLPEEQRVRVLELAAARHGLSVRRLETRK